MESIAVQVSSGRVPGATVVRSRSVDSLAAMSEKEVALTHRGEYSAAKRCERRSLIVVVRSAAAKRVREEEGRSRAMMAVMAVRACSASSWSPPLAFHDRNEAMAPRRAGGSLCLSVGLPTQPLRVSSQEFCAA